MAAEIGHRLKEARESGGFSLEGVAQESGIPQTYLRALEAGNFQQFESPYYTRVYLRTYAKILSLDPRSIINHYRELYRPDGTPLTSSKDLSPPRRPSPQDLKRGEAVKRGEVEGQQEEEPLRRVKLPPNLPDPEDLGLTQPPSTSVAYPLVPIAQSEVSAGKEEEKSRLSRLSARGNAPKKKNSSLAKWYNRLLILGALLLIPVAIFVFYKVVLADEVPTPKKSSQESTPSTGKEGEETSSAGVILREVDVGKGEIDHYELSNAKEVALSIEAKDECWILLGRQEVGNEIKEVTLKKGASFSYALKDGRELWLRVGRPHVVSLKVNGKRIPSPYKERKIFHISLIQ